MFTRACCRLHETSAEDLFETRAHVEVLGATRDRDEQVGSVEAPVIDHEIQCVIHRGLVIQAHELNKRTRTGIDTQNKEVHSR